MLRIIGSLLMVFCMLLGTACWFAAVYNLIRSWRRRKPGVPYGSFSYWTDGLTEEGKDARDRHYAYMLGFVFFAGLAACSGLATGAARWVDPSDAPKGGGKYEKLQDR